MKKLMFTLILALSIAFMMAFKANPISSLELVGTKWISPINDNCFESLCFTSEKNVMYYSCDSGWYTEVGFTVKEDIVEVNIFDSLGNQMTLKVDDGLLRQTPNHNNNTSRNFIKVPNGTCD